MEITDSFAMDINKYFPLFPIGKQYKKKVFPIFFFSLLKYWVDYKNRAPLKGQIKPVEEEDYQSDDFYYDPQR